MIDLDHCASEWLADLAAEAELLAAINALPARPREILRLHFVESLTREQIAIRMSVSTRVVKRELVRALVS